jgi:UDPglucose--hexose-1-phosphate uridylyltransferase
MSANPLPPEESMPQLRKDPIIGRWVIVAMGRRYRPDHFVDARATPAKRPFCPFCEGNEDKTPREVLSYREAGTYPDTPGWWLRVVPNKFPALRVEGDLDRQGEGMYDLMNGIGAHDVIIETPSHDLTMADYTDHQIQEVIWAYRDRMMELRKDSRFRYLLIFKNHGSEAGASLEHSHSQLIAIPIIPKRVMEEISGARHYFEDRSERCIYCDIVKHEIKVGVRVVLENAGFVAIAPFASRFPFETWILPKTHEAHFENLRKSHVQHLGAILKGVLSRIKRLLNDPPFNYLIHTAPCKQPDLPYFHWHIEIIPKLTRVAGFEWGTGFYINPTPPEEAARYLSEEYPEEKSDDKIVAIGSGGDASP